jgi:hypothetical protein
LALALTLLLANGIASWWSIDKLVANDAWVAHTHEVLSELKVVLPALTRANEDWVKRNGEKPATDLLTPPEALSSAHAAFDRIQVLTADNAA